jgi:chaperonin GroEL
MSHAVTVTLRPQGRNEIIAKKCGGPLLPKDGVTVARETELEAPSDNVGARFGPWNASHRS